MAGLSGPRLSMHGDPVEMLNSVRKSVRDIADESKQQQAASGRAQERWRSVQHAFYSVMHFRRLAKRMTCASAFTLGNPSDGFDGGSLSAYITPVEVLREASTKFSDVQPEPPPPQLPSPPEGTSSVMNSLFCLSPNQRMLRRRVHRLGDEISSRHVLSARNKSASPRAAKKIDFSMAPFDRSSAAQGSHGNMAESKWNSCEDPKIWPETRFLKQIRQNTNASQRCFIEALRSGPHTSRSNLPHGTHFNPGILDGQSRPQERHPMLASLAHMDGEGDETTGIPSQEPIHDRESSSISRRLESLRWKECRRGPWVEEPEKLPESSNARSKQSHQDAHHVAKRKAKAQDGASRTMEDFRQIAWLVDPEVGKHVPVESFVPLMFWFGLTRQYRTALRVFEIAFGPGSVAPDKIAQLAEYCDVQVRLTEGFQWLARRESFDELCDYMIDEDRLRSWFSSIKKDPSGRVGIGELQTMLQRMEVTSDKKVLFRFLSTFGALYNKGLMHPVGRMEENEATDNKLHPQTSTVSSTLTMSSTLLERNRFGFHFLMVLLCRCVVTWCFSRVLDLIDPLQSSPKVMDDDGASFRIARRWAEVHRRIVVSLLVNHRYWGRDGKVILFKLSQPALSVFGQDLKPEQWLALYQRVRAQGMASTFPEGAEFDDPDFLQKKAVSAATSKLPL